MSERRRATATVRPTHQSLACSDTPELSLLARRGGGRGTDWELNFRYVWTINTEPKNRNRKKPKRTMSKQKMGAAIQEYPNSWAGNPDEIKFQSSCQINLGEVLPEISEKLHSFYCRATSNSFLSSCIHRYNSYLSFIFVSVRYWRFAAHPSDLLELV